MKTTNGIEIIGYRYGPYWFGVYRGRISGLSGGSFADEKELVSSYDSVNGPDRTDGPGLIRVCAEGPEFVLRVGDNNTDGAAPQH